MVDYREIAEKKLGRPLYPTEVVHHIDGDSCNNDPDNLLVCNQSEHARIHSQMKIDFSFKLQELFREMMGEAGHKASRQFEEALEMFFSQKQIELIYRRAIYTRKCFSKTENEYWSRSIKKKLKALNRMLRFKSLLEVLLD